MPTMSSDVLRRDGQPVITEVSYYFESSLIRQCPGHWRVAGEELQWVDGAVYAEDVILDDFLGRMESRRR